MKRLLTAILAAALLLPAAAHANEPIVISVVASPTPEPIAAPITPEPAPINYQEYPWSQDDIDTVAQGYWVWCNTAQEKADFTAVVVNRMMCGLTRSDGSRMFPDTIEGVMTQGAEFGIDAARCSDKNRELAVANLNRCMTEWLMGNAGVRVPRSAIYVDRVGGVLTFYDATWNVVWRCE